MWSKFASLTAVVSLLSLLLMLQLIVLECGTEFDLIQFILERKRNTLNFKSEARACTGKNNFLDTTVRDIKS